ncbi:MAG: hypothetical protein JO057_01960 [Chloroflexi bacterium]|nr:hypothetical protein [Chloroflexota bacterium]
MLVALALTAIRRHPFSVAFTVILGIVTASLLRSSAPLVLSVWAIASLLSFELWYLLEPTVFMRLAGYREPTYAERQRLDAALGRTSLRVLVADSTALVAARGLRCLVISRDLMEVFEDRALTGVLNQTAASAQAANLAGYLLVWIGNLPLLAGWVACRVFGQFGRLLAVVVGTSLVLPLILCRDFFLRWTGWLFTIALVALVGTVLLSDGYALASLELLLAGLLVPSLRILLAWESRRVEAAADSLTIAAGYGPQLLEAVDFLALAEPLPVADKLLNIVCLPRFTSAQRAERIHRALGAPRVMS